MSEIEKLTVSDRARRRQWRPSSAALLRRHLAEHGGREAAPPRLPGDDFDVPFEEAIAWARQRKAVLPAEFYGARLQAVRALSFAVSGLAALDPAVLGLGKARTELIFRNAVQTNYGIGRTIQRRANAATRPSLMWDASNDGRPRPAHAAMGGHIAPVVDPIWKRWSPPTGRACSASMSRACAMRRR